MSCIVPNPKIFSIVPVDQKEQKIFTLKKMKSEYFDPFSLNKMTENNQWSKKLSINLTIDNS